MAPPPAPAPTAGPVRGPAGPGVRPPLPAPTAGDTPFVRGGRKIGRNEPCPCGPGKKYKQCHGRME
ncbi:MAG: hypothetical protein DYH19_11210, partial [Gammaproteobacteria bacterium PRO8]|nr:hypothetical protein [Gammaproteobacteria bacterium PRO8]